VRSQDEKGNDSANSGYCDVACFEVIGRITDPQMVSSSGVNSAGRLVGGAAVLRFPLCGTPFCCSFPTRRTPCWHEGAPRN